MLMNVQFILLNVLTAFVYIRLVKSLLNNKLLYLYELKPYSPIEILIKYNFYK